MAKKISEKKSKKPDRKKLIKQCDDLWSDCIIARDKTCRYSNSDYRLSAHHIRSRAHYSTRWLLDNGLTLAWKIHSLQKFQPELFQDKVIEIIGQDYYEEMKRKSLVRVDYSITDLEDMKKYLKHKLIELKAA